MEAPTDEDLRRSVARDIIKRRREAKEREELLRLHNVEQAARSLYDFLDKVLKGPDEHNSMLQMSGDEIACAGVVERLNELRNALYPKPQEETCD